MTFFHADKHIGDASVFVTLKPSHSLPTMTSKSVLIHCFKNKMLSNLDENGCGVGNSKLENVH